MILLIRDGVFLRPFDRLEWLIDSDASIYVVRVAESLILAFADSDVTLAQCQALGILLSRLKC